MCVETKSIGKVTAFFEQGFGSSAFGWNPGASVEVHHGIRLVL